MKEAEKTVRQRRSARNIFVGAKLGKLEIVGITKRINGAPVDCRCECGVIRPIRFSSLLNGAMSCGCSHARAIKHGLSSDLTYKVYLAMLDRCYKETHHAFQDYGNRGISVCDGWKNSFTKFLEDMGKKPDGLTLERINNDLGYSKENCKWATRKEQSQNRRCCISITINGITQNLAEWCRQMGLDEGTVRDRIRSGKSLSDSITIPVRHYSPRNSHK